MIQLKKTILTLVALLAVTTGAWAQTGEDIFQYCYDCQRNPAYPKTTASASLSGFANPYVGYKGSGFEAENTSAGPWKLEYMGLWSTTDKHGIDDVDYYQYTYNCTDVPVFRLYQWNATANEYQHAAYGVVCAYAKVSNTVEHTAMFVSKDGWCCVLTNSSHSSSMNITFDEDLTTGLTTLIAAATPNASGTPVDDFAWNAATKTGTFKMPGGNVTVSVEYYDLATLADNGLTAAVDAAAKTEAPLAVLAENAVTGGTLMYFVIYGENFSQADAIALAEDEWEAAIPTAETIDAAGTYYVWYYIKGDDEHSDTDPQRLAVTVLPEPTYAVEFAEGTEESDKWTAIPNAGVKKGETVTVTYTGTKKVIGVKAEKKAAAPTWDGPIASEATAADIGKVVCAAGHLHDAKTTVPDGCTAVGILGKVTETGHGLILALQDATNQTWNTINGWTSASYAGTTLKVLPDAGARGNLSSYETLGETTVSNWAVAQKSDYEAIFTNLGSTVSDSYGTTYDGNVNAYITTVGGTAITSGYWSATYDGGNYSWIFSSEYWDSYIKSNSVRVRPVLGF
ncbi:hypothetical protein L6466_14050 [Prevotella communis]|uniref:hypothetical protein n=1 Tax=Prevotella communis TaxID=2913614 RepID=UPI001EDB7BC1|nr:hypothetical protein [Prevotella communis]UKK67440.1 hypothetical protein L6464_12615 [Prevotella communis]UKK70413.1 hypothetical protein L6466_14050 [Prevotella communis]